MPTHADRHIPYTDEVEERYRPRRTPYGSLVVLWAGAAAVIAIVLFVLLALRYF